MCTQELRPFIYYLVAENEVYPLSSELVWASAVELYIELVWASAELYILPPPPSISICKLS